MEYFLAFIFGLVIGSFLNVCIYRLPKKEIIIYPASHCPSCGYFLSYLDLVPIISYLFLRGRCRNCQEKISPRYPLIELATGIFFVFAVVKFGFTLAGLFYALLLAALIVVFFIDLEHFLILNEVVIFILLLGIGLHILVKPFSYFNGILTAIGSFGLFLVLYLLHPGGMGAGDVKLAGALGLWLGWPDITLAVFLGSLLGLIIHLILMALKIRTRKDPLPFGVYLVLGTLIALFIGEEIWQWYFKLIF